MKIENPGMYQPGQTVDMETVTAMEGQMIFPVKGDCLEALGVVDGGFVAIDFTRFPLPPRYRSKGGDGSMDICACWATFPGKRSPSFMVKAYLGVWGTWLVVGTRYDLTKGEHQLDSAMEAQKVLGVVYASWDKDWNLLWARVPSSFPATIWTGQTIHGENIGDPMDVIQAAAVQKVKVAV